ncbi:MAG TPA: type II toxin-antitoxin system RelE/ParE family toxin [Thermoanaerobaculia bacterium]|nr:type II toxin-antitoxin system RelE/ParE family toxin [Thermoanaerobaculia bacterium]
MAYRLEFVSSAQREFLRLPSGVQERLEPHLNSLEQNPRPRGVKAMAGHRGLFRIRVGDYRILYEIDDASHVVTVTRVRQRGSAYRGL